MNHSSSDIPVTHVLKKIIFHGVDQDIIFDRFEVPQEIIHLIAYEYSSSLNPIENFSSLVCTLKQPMLL